MATPRRRPRSTHAGAPTPRREEPTPRKKAGRPKGPPSTIVNLRLPLELLARLDRYTDRPVFKSLFYLYNLDPLQARFPS